MGEPLKYSNDGVWDGKDWYTYKWVMEAVFSEKAMLGIADGDANLHLCKMFNTCTELKTLQYDVSGIDMVEMMLESLRAQAAFESLKSAVRYGADSSAFTLTKLREMIRAASVRKAEFRD
ncbi:hypothetical protein PC110_g11882 [Phytophthora cactorum]|uniref:Uncharacterized protein n=1 Tax=Phytophthora cactorum TaxID=29920 RepID=A0A329S4K1_9STRA|nr:hypothetical protein PC110_g11882 [Phytophthora cactorum]